MSLQYVRIKTNTKTISNMLLNYSSIRTKIHPTPARVEFIHGKSAIGKPVSLEPVRIQLERGKTYSWCSCGASQKQPFCDGSHKKLNLALKESEAKYEPLRFICEESRSVLLCMCKAASNRPFCDQTHEELKIKQQQQHQQIKASQQSN